MSFWYSGLAHHWPLFHSRYGAKLRFLQYSMERDPGGSEPPIHGLQKLNKKQLTLNAIVEHGPPLSEILVRILYNFCTEALCKGSPISVQKAVVL